MTTPSGSHTLITGGSSGIGLAIARRLAARGERLSLVARRREVLDAAIAELRERGAPDPLGVCADVSDAEAVAAAVSQADRHHGPISRLVLSAGVVDVGRFDALPDEAFSRDMGINYFGTLHAVRAALPSLRRAGGAQVVFLSSGAGLIGVFGYGAYAPSKFAVRGLAEVLRGELKAEGIAVHLVYPPDTETPQLAAERRERPPETEAIAGQGGCWSADAVAAAVLEGARRGRFVIAPGWQMTLLARLHGLIAPLLFAHFDRLAARVRK